jgi:hypothetical protein
MRASAAIVAIALGGVIYERIGEHRDRDRYLRIGRSMDIGGRTLNIYCSGEGSPAVIFEGAGHTAGYAWIAMQAEAAKFTRACWYDRAGYGWSDPGPSPRTFRAIANDLHALLRAAAVAPPYVLVGANSSAFHVRVYNALYPREVAGAVLIQADDPDVLEHEPEFLKGSLSALPPFLKRVGCKVLRPAMLQLGLLRLIGNPGAGRPFGLENFAGRERQELVFLSNNPSTVRTEGEGCFLDENMAEVRAAGNFGNRPLFVLANSTPFPAPGPQYAKATADLNDYWFHQLQPRLAALSTRGRLVINEHAEQPDAITAAIANAVTAVRAEQRITLE